MLVSISYLSLDQQTILIVLKEEEMDIVEKSLKMDQVFPSQLASPKLSHQHS